MRVRQRLGASVSVTVDALTPTQDLIRAAFEKWVKCLGLAWWKVVVRYYDDPSEILTRFDQQAAGRLTAATVSADWRYSEATIDVNLPAWVEMSADEIERAVVHELVHILVNEMREGEMHHEERVVTQITKAVFWIADAAEREAE
jgi:hypothetical protein